MKDSIEHLGSRIKNFFTSKDLEDKKAVESINGNLIDIEEAVKAVGSVFKEKTNKDVVQAVKVLEKALREKKLEVNVQAPIVNVPDPVIELVKETKEAKVANEILAKLLLLTQKQGEDNGVRVTNFTPADAIAVKLTDKSGKQFYDSIMQAFSTSGVGGDRIPKNYSVEVTKGNVPGVSWFVLQANNPKMIGGNTQETISDQGGLYEFLTSDTQLYLSSTDPLDVDIPIGATGADSTFNDIFRAGTLNGNNQVPINGLMFFVEYLFVQGANAPLGDIYLAEADSLTGGKPNTASKIKAKIPIGKGNSQLGLFICKAGTRAFPDFSAYTSPKGFNITIEPFLTRLGGVPYTGGTVSDYQSTSNFRLNGVTYFTGDVLEIRGTSDVADAVGSAFVDIEVHKD